MENTLYTYSPLLDIKNLNVSLNQYPLVKNLSFSIKKGECLCLVGESGCGKSLTGLSIMGLIAPELSLKADHILFEQENIALYSQKQLSLIRGNKIAMVFQDPLSSLNPVLNIGHQVAEPLIKHLKLPKKQALEEAMYLLDSVGIKDPQKRIKDYPHQFSGGMLQRVMIAMMLACKPLLLIADEPTTSLDQKNQTQIMLLLEKLIQNSNMALLFITHDLSLPKNIATHIGVMYAGELIELAPASQFYLKPNHPYSSGLFSSIPSPLYKKLKSFPTIPGNVPSPFQKIIGCSFKERCSKALPICSQSPPWKNNTRCWLQEE